MIKEILKKLIGSDVLDSNNELTELKKKVERLEVADAERRGAMEEMGQRYDRHLRTVSLVVAVPGLIISIAAILMAIFARISQTDSRDAVREMKAEIREAVSQMNSN